MTAIGVSVLGATGSIGASTLDVIERHSDKFRLVAATANRDAAAMQRICAKHQPSLVVMCDDDAAQQVADFVADAGLPCTVRSGAEALIDAATVEDAEQVMAAVVGGAGLAASLAAAAAGKRVLLANKEALVMAGDLFMRTVRAGGAELLPIDSEHNAIFQCLPAGFQCGHALQADSGVEQIILTASGGPFLGRAAESLAEVTVDEAVAHPNWSMGRKISVDSATMMNI
ncbi:1-deoxy-D-xylulose-5-phosphate reductoisomerase, partial [bacterium]|nr:1-deoxy-D-xylulose-5-phosphate reductoisomerase [bacterium]